MALFYPKNTIRVTSDYGMRNGKLHPGMDFGGVKIGDLNVYGVGTGIVTRIYKDPNPSNFGNAVQVYHPDEDKTSLFLHLDSIAVGMGQKVDERTLIGIEGNTGKSSGAHLHYSLYDGKYAGYRKNSIDPHEYLVAGPWQQIYEGAAGNAITTVKRSNGSDLVRLSDLNIDGTVKKVLDQVEDQGPAVKIGLLAMAIAVILGLTLD